MKNISKLALIAALAMTACNIDDPDDPHKLGKGGQSSVMAITESCTDTKAGVSGLDIVWEKGDAIYAYAPMAGLDYSSGELPIAGGAGTSVASISTSKAVNPDAFIWAPASLGNDINSLTWPDVQTYSADCSVSGIPMYCNEIESGDGFQNLMFKNLGGLLRLTVKGSEEFKLTGIEITASTPLAGTFSVEGKEPAAVLKTGDFSSVTTNRIRLEVPSVSLSGDGTVFHMALMEGEYSGIRIRFIFADQSPVVREIGDMLVIRRAGITSEEITMPDIKRYKAGCFICADEEKDLTAAAIINKVKAVTGSDNPWLDLLLSLKIYNPVHVARIFYYTTDPDGALVEASGVVAYQYSNISTLKYDRIVSFQHGTCNIADAPAYESDIAMELLPACIGDADKPKYYIAVMADYLGYGRSRTSDLQHPYMHSGLTGSACADMLSAAEEYIAGKKLTLSSNKIDLVGYSQGGAATLQTLMELERRGIDDSRINEVWAGAGPYDLEGFVDFFKNSANAYGKTGYVPFTFRGICYGDRLDISNGSIYNSALLNRMNLEFTFSNYQLSEWHDRLGSDITAILHPDFFKDGFNGNECIIRLMSALRSNSVVSKAQPRNVAKIKLFHSETDDTVPYACSESLTAAWPGVSGVTKLTTQNNHLKGGIEFMLLYSGLGDFISYL